MKNATEGPRQSLYRNGTLGQDEYSVGGSENGSHNVPHVVINDPVPIPALIGKYWTRDENIRKSTITRGSGGGYTKQEMYEYIQLQSV